MERYVFCKKIATSWNQLKSKCIDLLWQSSPVLARCFMLESSIYWCKDRTHSERFFCCDLKSDCLNQMQSGSISRKFLNDWSGRQDSNLRPHAPHACTLPGCATPRLWGCNYRALAVVSLSKKCEGCILLTQFHIAYCWNFDWIVKIQVNTKNSHSYLTLMIVSAPEKRSQ